MHGNVNDTTQGGEDSVIGFQALLKLEVLVPERMGQKVETDTVRTSFEEPEYESQCLAQAEGNGNGYEAGRQSTCAGVLRKCNNDPSAPSIAHPGLRITRRPGICE